MPRPFHFRSGPVRIPNAAHGRHRDRTFWRRALPEVQEPIVCALGRLRESALRLHPGEKPMKKLVAAVLAVGISVAVTAPAFAKDAPGKCGVMKYFDKTTKKCKSKG